jgi:single-strand DNA-binding protein
MSLNRVDLIGHLGADPEIRRTQDGRPIANLRVATSERWTDKASGQKREQTDWHTVVIFNEALAGIAEKYLRKGSKVFLSGKLQTRKWQDKEGRDRYATEVVLKGFDCKLEMLDGAGSGRPPPAESPEDYGTGSTTDRPATTRPTSFANELDDDIPF